MNWKKIIALGFAGFVAPTVGSWAQSCLGDACSAFTAGNVIQPAVPTLLTSAVALLALFTNPKKKQ